MRPLNKIIDKNWLRVFFKLLHDTLFILLVFFALSLVAEGLLPGIIASHFGMSKFIVLILINIFLITLTGPFLKAEVSAPLANKKMILAISFLGIILIMNGLLKMNIFLNFFVTALAIIIAYLAFQVILQEEQS